MPKLKKPKSIGAARTSLTSQSSPARMEATVPGSFSSVPDPTDTAPLIGSPSVTPSEATTVRLHTPNSLPEVPVQDGVHVSQEQSLAKAVALGNLATWTFAGLDSVHPSDSSRPSSPVNEAPTPSPRTVSFPEENNGTSYKRSRSEGSISLKEILSTFHPAKRINTQASRTEINDPEESSSDKSEGSSVTKPDTAPTPLASATAPLAPYRSITNEDMTLPPAPHLPTFPLPPYVHDPNTMLPLLLSQLEEEDVYRLEDDDGLDEILDFGKDVEDFPPTSSAKH